MTYHLLDRDGGKIRVATARTKKGVWVGWPGGAAFVERTSTVAGRAAKEDGVRAPMTGKVVSVSAQPGQAVAKDSVLVILEAMKMEYRLVAPRDGTVQDVHCAEGELVDLGAVLVTLSHADAAGAP